MKIVVEHPLTTFLCLLGHKIALTLESQGASNIWIGDAHAISAIASVALWLALACRLTRGHTVCVGLPTSKATIILDDTIYLAGRIRIANASEMLDEFCVG